MRISWLALPGLLATALLFWNYGVLLRSLPADRTLLVAWMRTHLDVLPTLVWFLGTALILGAALLRPRRPAP